MKSKLHKFLNKHRHWLALSVWAVGMLGMGTIWASVVIFTKIPGALGMCTGTLLMIYGLLCTIAVGILRKAEDYADKS